MLMTDLTNGSVNEIFDPKHVDDFYRGVVNGRVETLRADRATNYSVVRLELLEQIYHDLYEQSVRQPDKTRWQHRILPSREVVEISSSHQNKERRLLLGIKDINPLGQSAIVELEELEVDAVLLATGYVRDAHEDMLKDIEHLRPSGQSRWHVRRDYKVELDVDKVDSDAGIWLQGCNEGTHGLSDTLLSLLAVRGGEMVASIFGTRNEEAR
jgi:L-ornithine N5-monooxygenase